MSALLDEVIKFRKEQADRYEEYLRKIADLVGKVQAGHDDTTPEPLRRSAGLRAIYDNLVVPPPRTTVNLQDEAGPLPLPDPKLKLALDIDDAVKRERHASWRGNAARENHIKREALMPLLKDVAEVERIFEIIKQQTEY
jgi:type I restriction enzyme R subunit